MHLKCENLQRTGSYKLRGAYHRISALSAEERARGVVAASAGNHAQGVAYAARELGIRATIFMPVGVALPKLDATRQYGADVVLQGDSIGETIEAAAAFAVETGAVIIPPFDHPDVIAGQGTLGLEILEQVPDATTIVVPIGGGGLAAGIASAAKQQAAREGRPLRIIGVQAENAAPYIASLAAGEPRQVPVVPTIADGIAVYRPGELNFAIIRDTIDEVVTVSEDDIARALLVLLERAKLVVEPAGAVAVAAMMTGAVKSDGPIVAVLSGGNIDPMLMQRVVAHGLAASDRYLTISVGPARPPRPARTSGGAPRRGERERHRGAAHAARLGPADLRGRAAAVGRDPGARAPRGGRRGAPARRLRPQGRGRLSPSRRARGERMARASRCCPTEVRASGCRVRCGSRYDDGPRASRRGRRRFGCGYWPPQVSTRVTSTGISRPFGAV